MKKGIFLFFIFIYLLNFAYSQEFSVRGVIIDSASGNPLPGASILMIKLPDSIKVGSTSNKRGIFFFQNLSPGKYTMRISYVAYKPFSRRVNIVDRNLELGEIRLSETGSELDEIEVTALMPSAEQVGDTLQFNAGAFKTNPDATAEDLAQKLPGVSVEGGQVKAQGEDVKKVLVDGRQFFGEDPLAALRNLPSEIIDKVQIFDQRSEQAAFTGVDDGQTSKTMNILTKQFMRNGQFGKIYGGYGLDNRYQLGSSINIFDNDRRITILGMSNNISNQNFTPEDILGIMGGGSSGGARFFRMMAGSGFNPQMFRRSGGGSPGGGFFNNFLVMPQNGISSTHSIGINYTDKWFDKIDINGSYFFNTTSNNSESFTKREFILTSGNGQIYNEKSLSQSKNTNHRFNFRIDYTIDSSNSILLRPRLSYQPNNSSSSTDGSTYLANLPINSTDNNYNSDLRGLNFANEFLYRLKFAKKGRTFSIGVDNSYKDRRGESYLLSENSYFMNNPFIDSLNQFSDFLSKGWEHSANINYTEPLFSKDLIQFSYRISNQNSSSDKKTYNYDLPLQSYSIIDSVLTNVYESDYFSQQAGLAYRYSDELFEFSAQSNARWSKLTGSRSFPFSEKIEKSFFNLVPSAYLRYNFSKTHNLRFNYYTYTVPPSVDQLQDVINNSNPLQLTAGNPELNQSYTHSFSLRYMQTGTDNSTVFFGMLGGQFTKDYIGNKTIIATKDTLIEKNLFLPIGTKFTTPINLSNYWSLRSFINYGFPLTFILSKLNLNAFAEYSNIPGIINGLENTTKSSTFALSVILTSNISEKIDFTIMSRSSFNWAVNEIQKDLNTQYLNQYTQAKFSFIFFDNFALQLDVNHQLYSGMSTDYNIDFFLMNVSLAYKFLPRNQAEIKLSLVDALNSNNSVQRNVTDSYIEDIKTLVLQRYGLLTFTYNIRNFGPR
mgnify:FL=1